MAAAKKKVAKKKAARTTPKVSPLRGMSIEAWIEAKTHDWQGTVVRRLIQLVKRASPTATVSIKWSQPVFEHQGPIAFIKPAKAHVTFGFWRGAELHDPDNVLQGGDRMKHVKLESTADVDDARLTAWIKAATALNLSKGDPTRRTR